MEYLGSRLALETVQDLKAEKIFSDQVRSQVAAFAQSVCEEESRRVKEEEMAEMACAQIMGLIFRNEAVEDFSDFDFDSVVMIAEDLVVE